MEKKRRGNPYPHVKYTERGDPYVNADEVLNDERGKMLIERMKLIEDVMEKNSSYNKSSSKKQ